MYVGKGRAQKLAAGQREIGPRLMAVWPTSARKASYETYAFDQTAWDGSSAERREAWVRMVGKYITKHLIDMEVDLSTVRWEMLYPLEGHA